jgi:hypothetical protein
LPTEVGRNARKDILTILTDDFTAYLLSELKKYAPFFSQDNLFGAMLTVNVNSQREESLCASGSAIAQRRAVQARRCRAISQSLYWFQNIYTALNALSHLKKTGITGSMSLPIPANHGTSFASSSPAIDPESIQAQLQLILISPPFLHSKRYPRFLRFIVDETLAGKAERLKERVLGIEVFDRKPDYDMASDPIVRIVAGEIRKRLAQYYVDHEKELRIQLQPGSYVPEFSWPEVSSSQTQTEPPSNSEQPIPYEAVAVQSAIPGFKVIGAIAIFLIALIGGGIYLATLHRASPIEMFWGPILKSDAAPVICLGDVGFFINGTEDVHSFEVRRILERKELLALPDVVALNQISSVLTAHGKRPSVFNSTAVAYEQLQRHPVILIGWVDNQWSARVMQSLRFQLVKINQEHLYGVRDTERPNEIKWSVDLAGSANDVPRTYSIVARLHDPTTGQPTVLLGGVGLNGTTSASEFVTSQESMRSFVNQAPRGWENKNIEIVLEAQVIHGETGPPHIIATQIW